MVLLRRKQKGKADRLLILEASVETILPGAENTAALEAGRGKDKILAWSLWKELVLPTSFFSLL